MVLIKKIRVIIFCFGVFFCLSIRAAGQYEAAPMTESQFRRALNIDYIVLFTDDPGKRRLRIFANVVYDDLQFLKEDSLFKAEYRVTFSLLDAKGGYITGDRIDKTIVTRDYYATNSRSQYDWVEANFDLAPGNYKLILDLVDTDSRSSDRAEREIKVSSFKEEDILVAGPILLDTVMVDENNNVSLTPSISGTVFTGEKNIWVYFEVMCREYPADVSVTYHLIDSKGGERLTGDFSRHIESAVLRDKFRLDLGEFNFDDYQLVLKVEQGKKQTSKTKKFRIHWPELPPTIRDLDNAIEQLTYIATERDITRLKVDYEGRRLEMFLEYWRKWAKTEAEAFNLMEEYYRRIYESNQYFSEGGWKSDRGHVYVLYGPPGEIERHPYDIYSKAYEVWYYLEDNRQFIFVDEGGFGDYRLRSPLWQN